MSVPRTSGIKVEPLTPLLVASRQPSGAREGRDVDVLSQLSSRFRWDERDVDESPAACAGKPSDGNVTRRACHANASNASALRGAGGGCSGLPGCLSRCCSDCYASELPTASAAAAAGVDSPLAPDGCRFCTYDLASGVRYCFYLSFREASVRLSRRRAAFWSRNLSARDSSMRFAYSSRSPTSAPTSARKASRPARFWVEGSIRDCKRFTC